MGKQSRAKRRAAPLAGVSSAAVEKVLKQPDKGRDCRKCGRRSSRFWLEPMCPFCAADYQAPAGSSTEERPPY